MLRLELKKIEDKLSNGTHERQALLWSIAVDHNDRRVKSMEEDPSSNGEIGMVINAMGQQHLSSEGHNKRAPGTGGLWSPVAFCRHGCRC